MITPLHFAPKHAHGAKLTYKTQFACCFDIVADVQDTIIIDPGHRVLIPTGLTQTALVFKKSKTVMMLRILPRSGLSVRGVDVGAGVVDPDYIGKEIMVLLINNSQFPFEVHTGDRIAQGTHIKCFRNPGIEIEQIVRTSGFGSTGIK